MGALRHDPAGKLSAATGILTFISILIFSGSWLSPLTSNSSFSAPCALLAIAMTDHRSPPYIKCKTERKKYAE